MTNADATEILSIDLITRNPTVRSGRPVIRGTTLEVVDVVLTRFQNQLDAESLAAWFQIGAAETHAVLAYYYLHKAEIDALISERDRVVVEMREKLSDKRPTSLHR